MERLTTACSRDCPDACTLVADLEDGRLVALKGSAEDPVTRGFLCPRTTRFVQRQYSDQRLMTPMLRVPGEERFEPLSWTQALDLAANRLQQIKAEHGPEAILHYRSGGAMGYLKSLTSVFFEQFGPVATKRGDICSGAGEWAQEQDFGLSDSSDPEDLLNSKLIIIWGKNIHTSSVHLLPILLEAKRNGTVLVGIDPGPNRARQICDLFLSPRAGTDAQLALALVGHLADHDCLAPQAEQYCANLPEFLKMATARTFEERMTLCQIPLDQGLRLAQMYRELSPSSILVGWGAPRRTNGADTVRCLDALAAISGNIGRSGACVSFYHQRRRSFRGDALPPPRDPPRSFSETRLGAELKRADPRVRAVWITAGNPVAMLPDSRTVAEELRRADFTVVVETHWTDTALCADLVLPTLTLVEDEDVLGAYGNHYLRASKPAIAPTGEARHELWIHQQLAQRLGFGELLEGSPQEWKERLLKPEVDRKLFTGVPVRQPGAPTVCFDGQHFPTKDGKVNLITTEPGLPEEPARKFPLRLMALAHPDSQSSQWSVEPPEVPLARVSSEADPAYLEGSVMLLESRRGGFQVRIRREEGIHPELVILPKGGSRLFGGWCPNDLIEAIETDHGGGASFYEEPVRLRLPEVT